MTDNTLFTGDDNHQTTNKYIEELVGENKPFASVEEVPEYVLKLAKGKHEADQFIGSVTNENKELRQELFGAKRVEELVRQLETRNTPPQTVVNNEPHPNMDNGSQTQQIDIDKLLDEKLNQYNQRQSQSSNLALVKRELQTHLGDNYGTVVKSKAMSLGLSEEDVNNLARTSPQIVLELFGANKKTPTPVGPPSSTINSTSLSNTRSDVRNQSFYAKLRKDNPTAYWNQKTQVQMHKDAQTLGEQFFN